MTAPPLLTAGINDMKSTLKTFLAGNNPLRMGGLSRAQSLFSASGFDEGLLSENIQDLEDGSCWFVDVLDDNTAITYEVPADAQS
jgi:hypothetical protein